ncbi:MAG: DUF3788 family protein [Methanobacteriota archaeon]|nr:MAG: DUF3788 family protein [Euryarchaeota archaeon]
MEGTAGGASVEGLVAGLPEPARAVVQALRGALLGLGGVSEKVIVDYDVRQESPAFYVGARQLCHVHAGDGPVSVTVSLGRTLTFEVLRSRAIPEAIRNVVERTREYGATRWVSVTIATPADVEGLIPLLRLKHSFLFESEGELAIPRDQTTLEAFEGPRKGG